MKKNETDQFLPWVRLIHTTGLSANTVRDLLTHFRTPENLLAANHAELASLGVSRKILDQLAAPPTDRIEKDLSWLSEPDHYLITITDERYPERLLNISDAPIALYVWGDPEYLNQPQIAIVGSRTPTVSGQKIAAEFAHYLSSAGLTITSGLARGIDGVSHRGALDGLGGTIAILAHGLDIIYPAEHQQLARSITENGALVSEFPIGTTPHKGLFPKRNRLISGMSIGTLVVEAALKSGSLITARSASEQGREVFAIPGSIHNPLAKGCHQLIRQGAKLVETASDILEELHPLLSDFGKTTPPTETAADENPTLDPDHQKLLKCLAYEPKSVDDLVAQSGFSASEVASMLLILELEGNVVCQNGVYTQVS